MFRTLTNPFAPASNGLALQQQTQAGGFQPAQAEAPQIDGGLLSQGAAGQQPHAGFAAPSFGGMAQTLGHPQATAAGVFQGAGKTWEQLMQQYGHLMPAFHSPVGKPGMPTGLLPMGPPMAKPGVLG